MEENKKMKRQYRSYDEAKKFVRPLNLKNYNEWIAYCKSGNKPDDIPSDPWNVYAKEWCGNGLFLGVYDPNLEKRGYRTLHESMVVVHQLNLKNYNEWIAYCKSGKKPITIPDEPDKVYKKEGWLGWGHWLGTVKKPDPDEEYALRTKNVFRSFEDAKKFVQKEKFNDRKLHEQYWYNYCRSGNKPNDIPSYPDIVYYKEWKGFADFFNTDTPEYRSFNETKKFVRKLGLKDKNDWEVYCKSGNKPDNIPSNPNIIYYEKWRGFDDFFGTGVPPEYRSFNETKKFVRKLGLKNRDEWIAYCKSGNKPDDIPALPWEVYKKENMLEKKTDLSKVNINIS
jgi:hypothetical protein